MREPHWPSWTCGMLSGVVMSALIVVTDAPWASWLAIIPAMAASRSVVRSIAWLESATREKVR